MDESQVQHYQSAIEALLFVCDKPIVMDQFKTVFPELKPSDVTGIIVTLQDEYLARNSGMAIMEIAGGWQMLSNSQAAPYIREFYKTRAKEKLSRPALESLAIIAYKQPVGRAEVEVVRGVNSDGTIAHLLNKGLIEIVGRKEVPGRPFIYGTTKAFLEYFGLKSLDGLPKIEELANINLESAVISDPQAGLESVAPQAILPTVDESTGQEPSGASRTTHEFANAQTEN